MLRKLYSIILIFFSVTIYAANFSSFAEHKIQIPPEQAFRVNAVLESETSLKISFNIMPDFYIYKERVLIKGDNPQVFGDQDIKLPSGFKMNVFNGESYTEETVLNGSFTVHVLLKQPIEKLALTVHLQGCDGKTICYPPQIYKFELGQSSPFTSFKQLFSEIYSGTTTRNQVNPIELFLVFFLAGVAISLTPCMYPLYPIALSSISQTATKKSSIIKLSLCYIHGISIIYVLMGVIAAFSGHLLITLIQTPVFVLISSAIFLLLGLAMFDLLEIKLPNRLHNYIHVKSANLSGGGYLSAFVLGILSSFLLGPCVTPPLIIAIGYIASSGKVINGVLGLYAISLGMGLPILILSTVGNRLLPKSGAWMNIIKHIMGLIIIALAIYIAYPVINLGNPLLSIGVLCFITALAFLLIKQFRSHDLELLIHKIMPILMIVIGLIFTVLSTHKSVVADVNAETIATSGGYIVSLNELDQIVLKSDKPIIIIVSAKWCAICRELEATTFKDKDILEKFKQFTIIHFDITDNQPDSATLLSRYKLYGPPAILILNKDKDLEDKITGYINAEDLLKRLEFK